MEQMTLPRRRNSFFAMMDPGGAASAYLSNESAYEHELLPRGRGFSELGTVA